MDSYGRLTSYLKFTPSIPISSPPASFMGTTQKLIEGLPDLNALDKGDPAGLPRWYQQTSNTFINPQILALSFPVCSRPFRPSLFESIRISHLVVSWLRDPQTAHRGSVPDKKAREEVFERNLERN